MCCLSPSSGSCRLCSVRFPRLRQPEAAATDHILSSVLPCQCDSGCQKAWQALSDLLGRWSGSKSKSCLHPLPKSACCQSATCSIAWQLSGLGTPHPKRGSLDQSAIAGFCVSEILLLHQQTLIILQLSHGLTHQLSLGWAFHLILFFHHQQLISYLSIVDCRFFQCLLKHRHRQCWESGCLLLLKPHFQWMFEVNPQVAYL